MKAGNPRFIEGTRNDVERFHSLGWYHSIELPSGEVIPGLQTIDQLRFRLRQFAIPEDLSGKRVLDIGAWDGWFSFELEKRGASVLAVDAVENEKFLVARQLLNSRVEYLVADVYDLRPSELGKFDVVLFLGVLYHLKHPLLGLERVCAMSKDLACIESYVIDEGEQATPRMEFYEGIELCGQFDNWVGPNAACLTSMCRTAGFVRVTLNSVVDHRAHVTCFRQWEVEEPAGMAPFLESLENAVSRNLVLNCNTTFLY